MAADNNADPSDAPWRIVASHYIATVDALTPTLAEELRHIAEHWEEWATDTITSAIRAAADRAEQTEQERDEARKRATTNLRAVDAVRAQRDEARAEVERLTADDKRKDKAAAEGVEILLRKNGDLTNTIARLVTTSNIINNGGRITYTEKDGKPVQESDTTTWKADE